MTAARYLIGDVFDMLATLPDDSVDLVMTSPPFLALRSYLPADHPDKSKEIGSEATPAEFIDTLLDVVEACERVLAPHGSMCIELGDTYSGSGGAGGDYGDQGMREGQPKFLGSNGRRNRPADVAAGLLSPTKRPGPQGRDSIDGWPLDKSLCLIPEIFRFSLVYGFNPLTGRQTPRWRARNVIRWVRPNPPVGALGDKFRPGTSEMVVICKSRTRYFDLDAVRTPGERTGEVAAVTDRRRAHCVPGSGPDGTRGVVAQNPAGAPPLDYWVIPTQPYDGSHYATYPEKLCEIPIKAMCPLKVCTVCGQPSKRIVETAYEANRNTNGPQSIDRKHLDGGSPGFSVRAERVSETVGWTDCGHGSYRTGVVLDPFGGSGTTLAVATGHGRDAIGIDIDARNADLALDRVGPLMLTLETPEAAA